MKTTTQLILILGVLIAAIGIEAAIDQIWLSPTNVTAMVGYVNMPDYADAPKGVWTSISTGISGRVERPIVEIDSKGLIWVFGGKTSETYYLNAVWNYDPKTDLYRWVAGNVDTPLSDNLVYGDFGIPSADAFPGGKIGFSASTIDRNDNIWFYGGEYDSPLDFWRFNTMSFEFTYFGLSDPTTLPLMFTDKGVPSPKNYPGYVEGAILVLDSKNNLWLVSGYNYLQKPINAIWHFNTTSLEWSWMWGSFNTTDTIDYENGYMNGRWEARGFIDSDDRIWLFGGWGHDVGGSVAEWGDMWSFDTKTLQWRVEWKTENSFLNPSTVASSDYDPGNIPSARVAAQLVDRLDGTLMIAGGYQYASNVFLNDIWLYNKTSKMWKMVDGELKGGSIASNYTNYRQVGGQMGTRQYYGSPSGINNRGHFIIYGGIDAYTALNDIWVIPQDPCILCDVNAVCNATDIWNGCTCKEGYNGDGMKCTLDVAPVADDSPLASPGSASPVSDNAPVGTKTPQSKYTSSSAAFVANFGLLAILSVFAN